VSHWLLAGGSPVLYPCGRSLGCASILSRLWADKSTCRKSQRRKVKHFHRLRLCELPMILKQRALLLEPSRKYIHVWWGTWDWTVVGKKGHLTFRQSQKLPARALQQRANHCRARAPPHQSPLHEPAYFVGAEHHAGTDLTVSSDACFSLG